MQQEFYTLLNFNFIRIYRIHEISVLLKTLKRFFDDYNRLLFSKKIMMKIMLKSDDKI